MIAADVAVRDRDPDLPVLAAVLEPEHLARALAGPGSDRAAVRVMVHRVRYKPRTSVLAAVVVDRAGERRWLRIAGYRRGRRAKLDKDRRWARRRGSTIPAEDAASAWIATDPWADRGLGLRRAADLPRSWSILTYNPGRRIVAAGNGPDGDALVVKVHAPGRRRVADGFLRALAEAGAPVPGVVEAPIPGATGTLRVPGEPARPGDAEAVADALARLRRAADPASLRPIDADHLRRRARRAWRTVGAVLPDLARSAAGLVDALDGALDGGLADAAPAVIGFVHGDLSPDQAIVSPVTGRAVLLDLDECGAGPLGWDAASWLAAQAAKGLTRPVPLPGPPPDPVLLAAALVIRAPEPFQRRRAGWDAMTTRMLARAAGLLDAPITVGPRAGDPA